MGRGRITEVIKNRIDSEVLNITSSSGLLPIKRLEVVTDVKVSNILQKWRRFRPFHFHEFHAPWVETVETDIVTAASILY
jgi:hypothetical protein